MAAGVALLLTDNRPPFDTRPAVRVLPAINKRDIMRVMYRAGGGTLFLHKKIKNFLAGVDVDTTGRGVL